MLSLKIIHQVQSPAVVQNPVQISFSGFIISHSMLAEITKLSQQLHCIQLSLVIPLCDKIINYLDHCDIIQLDNIYLFEQKIMAQFSYLASWLLPQLATQQLVYHTVNFVSLCEVLIYGDVMGLQISISQSYSYILVSAQLLLHVSQLILHLK